jgi:hypothetical protein
MADATTARTRQVAFRFPEELVVRLDQYGKRLRAKQRGLDLTRADVVRMLLNQALDAELLESLPGPRKRRR